jgi:hypothetical protein
MNIADQTFPAVDSANEDRAQAIRDQLRDAIVDRRLAPGTKLSEGEVGTLFDVSRTVARAAPSSPTRRRRKHARSLLRAGSSSPASRLPRPNA